MKPPQAMLYNLDILQGSLQVVNAVCLADWFEPRTNNAIDEH